MSPGLQKRLLILGREESECKHTTYVIRRSSRNLPTSPVFPFMCALRLLLSFRPRLRSGATPGFPRRRGASSRVPHPSRPLRRVREATYDRRIPATHFRRRPKRRSDEDRNFATRLGSRSSESKDLPSAPPRDLPSCADSTSPYQCARSEPSNFPRAWKFHLAVSVSSSSISRYAWAWLARPADE